MTEKLLGYVAEGSYSPGSRFSFRYRITRPDGTHVVHMTEDSWGPTEFFDVWGWESRVRKNMRKHMMRAYKYDQEVANPRAIVETFTTHVIL